MKVARYRCEACDLTIEGTFELTALARLSLEEQAFVTAFVRVHGNIKRMEGLFGISYPTVKNRLNALTEKLDAQFRAPEDPTRVLEQLARGEISVEDALKQLPER